MVFTQHVTDNTRALHKLCTCSVSAVVHRVEDASVHGFEPVAHVRQCAVSDDAHRVVDKALAHFCDDIDWNHVLAFCLGLSL